jgi:hypothetical protein
VVVFPGGNISLLFDPAEEPGSSASGAGQHNRRCRLSAPDEQTGYNGGVYDAAEPKTEWDAYQDYGHNHWHNSLIWGEDIHDFSITGTGLIWGKGSFGRRASRGGYPILQGRAGGRGQQGHRAQELPQRASARLLRCSRAAIFACC